MTASAVPAALDAVVALFTAAGITTYDGPGASDDAATSYVLVGVQDPDVDGPATSATATSQWAWLGHVERDETFSLHCSAVGWNGDADQKSARDNVYALMGQVATAITTDPTLGGVLLYAVGLSTSDLRQDQDQNGAIALLGFDLECRARLT